MKDKDHLIHHLLMARNFALQLGCNTQDAIVYNLGKLLEKKLESIENHFERLEKK
jgi:hypothetical protein